MLEIHQQAASRRWSEVLDVAGWLVKPAEAENSLSKKPDALREDHWVQVITWYETDSPLRNSKRRVNRAAEHLTELAKLFGEYTTANSGTLYLVLNPDKPPHMGGEFTFDWSEGRTPPSRIGILAGEVVYNLRAATDYLVYALAALDAGTPNEKSQFPIEEKEKVYREVRRNTWLQGVNDKHVDQLAAYQPFAGCKWTRTLRDLSNFDKHRQLTPINPTWKGQLPARDALFEPFPGQPSRVRAPLRDQTCDVRMADRFPLIETLNELGGGVRSLVEEFEPDFDSAG